MANGSGQSMFLRRSLQANGAFSVATGLAMIIACVPLANLLGLSHPAILAGIGVSLLVFAVGLLRNSRRPHNPLSVPPSSSLQIIDIRRKLDNYL